MPEAENSTTQAFESEWNALHSGRQPIGPILRSDETLPWVRFHALPGSKRYAENETERAIILHRANTLGDTILGYSDCWLVTLEQPAGNRSWSLGGRIEYDVETPDEFIVPYYVQETIWRNGAFDDLLTAIADDDARYVWISRRDGSIFAPYDGGFDLFALSYLRIAELKVQWAGWLPHRPDGL
jgi:hypothetical protein